MGGGCQRTVAHRSNGATRGTYETVSTFFYSPCSPVVFVRKALCIDQAAKQNGSINATTMIPVRARASGVPEPSTTRHSRIADGGPAYGAPW